MAEKVGGRWQEEIRSGVEWDSGHSLTVTRRGVEVMGWHSGSYGTGEPIELTWEEFDAMRERVMNGESR